MQGKIALFNIKINLLYRMTFVKAAVSYTPIKGYTTHVIRNANLHKIQYIYKQVP